MKKAPILRDFCLTEIPRCLRPFQEEKGPRPGWGTKVEKWKPGPFGSGIEEEEERA